MNIDQMQGVTYPDGFSASGVYCGIKSSPETKDLALIHSENPANTAGVFTKNLVKAAPVKISKKRIDNHGMLQAIIVNSGNANACTGEKGLEDAKRMTEVTAETLNLDNELVGVCSTGIIGQLLPMEKILPAVKRAEEKLHRDGGPSASRAIITTDTRPKIAQNEVTVNSNKKIKIGGMAKGSGMIFPDMATMLAFITTDAEIDTEALNEALKYAADRSFNSISVDGHTSTNDSVILMANGKSNIKIESGTQNFELFKNSLQQVSQSLAKQIVSDGEGASTLIEIEIKGAESFEQARQIGLSIANSTLVKTAVFGEDPNWGRIISAAGYSGAKFDPDLVDIYIGDILVSKQGCLIEFDQDKAEELLKKNEVLIIFDLNMGQAKTTVWTCDFTHDYIDLNSTYPT